MISVLISFSITQQTTCNRFSHVMGGMLKGALTAYIGYKTLIRDLCAVYLRHSESEIFPDDIEPNTRKFIQNSLIDAGYSKEHVNKIGFNYTSDDLNFASCFKTIRAPITDSSLEYYEKPQPTANSINKKALWQAILLHEMHHLDNKHIAQKDFLINVSNLTALYYIHAKKSLKTKQLLGIGLLPTILQKLQSKSHEFNADMNVIKRSKDPALLQAMADWMHTKDETGSNAYKIIITELLSTHPSPFIRSYYFAKAAERLRNSKK